MAAVPFIAQLWILIALPSLSQSATCTTSSGEEPSCQAENSFLQVGLAMSHNNTEKEQRTVDADGTWIPFVAEGELVTKPPLSSMYANSEVAVAISAGVRSRLEEMGGRPRLTQNIDADTLGDRVVYFPGWVLILIGSYYVLVMVHEVYINCFGGWPLLQNRVPQKSIGLQMLTLWGWMSGLMTSAVSIPLSLDYTIAMGMDPVLSGFFLSASCISGMIGMILGRVFIDDSKWSQRAIRRWMILLPEAAGLVGLANFYLMQWVAAQPLETRKSWFWGCLGAQQLQAVLGASVLIPNAVVWNKCTPNKDKTFWTMLQQSTKMLGMALGPAVSALVIYAVQGDGERVSPVSMQAWMNFTIMAMNLISGLLTLMYLPVEIPPFDENAEEAPPQQRQRQAPLQPGRLFGAPLPVPKKLEPGPEDLEPADREKLIWHTLQFALERPLTVSAVEVATVMILEAEYGWPRESTGIVFFIIACLGAVFSLLVAHLIRTRSLRESYLVFSSGIVSVLASLLLFDFGASAGMWTLLAADPLLFTLALTSWGICEGWATQAVMPGKWYSIENFRLFDGLLMSLGRCIAPIVSRILIDIGGRNAYAVSQVLVVAFGFHSLKCNCSLFWNLEKKMEQEKVAKLQVPDELKKETLPDPVQKVIKEASPETDPAPLSGEAAPETSPASSGL